MIDLDTSGSMSTESNNLHKVDPDDPNVLYPPYYIPPPGFIPRSPSSIISDEDDVAEYRINGMPPGFRGMSLIYYFYFHLILML